MSSQEVRSPITSNGSRKRPRRAPADQSNASCRRCKEKKIKCDAEVPICRPCSKTSSTCVIVDSSTGKEYTRSQIQALHDQIQELQEQLLSRGVTIDQPQEIDQSNRPTSSIPNRLPSQSKRQPRHIPKFIGDESGTGFIQYILQAISRGWKDTLSSQPVNESLSAPAIIDHPAHTLPTSSEARSLVSAYLSGFHIQHTFLQRSSLENLLQNVYERQFRLATTEFSIGEKHELFQLNLVFALASIDDFRKGKSDKHPFGYFTAGLQHLNGVMSFESLRDVQGFLLIAHFGLYYYIGCSVWEIGQICLRICIEQGLHRDSRISPKTLLEEQMRRRIFWSCYHLDRLSSVALGRPFGIDDSDIEIGLPFDAEDRELEQQTNWSSNEMISLSGMSSSNGEVTVFNCCIKLGQIACRIHTSLNCGIPSHSSTRKSMMSRTCNFPNIVLEPGDTYQLFRGFFSELRAWRLSCPVFQRLESPTQTQEMFDFMYEKEKFTLARAVIDRVHSRASFPPKELLNPCHNAAVAIIHLYNDLRKHGHVTYSWSYLQLLLVCGLSVVFCVFVKLDRRRKEHTREERSWLSYRWIDIEPETFKDFNLQESSSAIDVCAEIHSWMAEHSKDMGRYARFFDMMRCGVQEKIKQFENRSQNLSGQNSSTQQIFHNNAAQQSMAPPLGNNLTNQFHDQNERDFTAGNYLGEDMQFYSEQTTGDISFQSQHTLDPNFFQQLQDNWYGTGAEDTFEPLVRQLFGVDQTPDFQNFDISAMSSDFSGWDFPADPLLAEFTSGLEGFM